MQVENQKKQLKLEMKLETQLKP